MESHVATVLGLMLRILKDLDASRHLIVKRVENQSICRSLIMDQIATLKKNLESQLLMPVTQLAISSLDPILVDGAIKFQLPAKKLLLLLTMASFLSENVHGISKIKIYLIAILKKQNTNMVSTISKNGLQPQKSEIYS